MAACAPNSFINLEACLFKVDIHFTASASIVFEAKSFLIAVDTIPEPRGLVKIKRSFGFAPEFFINEDSSISPVTTKPYLGSLSSIECPPRIGIPASSALFAPPSKI